MLKGRCKDIKGYSRYTAFGDGEGEVWDNEEEMFVNKVKCGKYLFIAMRSDDGKWHTGLRLHRVLAEAFIDNPKNLPQVNHKDENPENNNIDNLEWCTAKDNSNYGTRNERISEKLTNGKRSKKVAQYTLEGKLVKVWPSSMEIQRQLGYSQGNISMCCRGERRVAYGFVWKYIE